MKLKICKSCNKEFLTYKDNDFSHCRMCVNSFRKEQELKKKEAQDLKWREQKKRNQELFEKEIQRYQLVSIDSITPSKSTLYIIGNGFDLMHRVPSSYYNFRDSLGKHNRLREMLECVLTPKDIWADFENALGNQNLDLMGSRHIIDMWLDDFGFFDEDSGVAEYYMTVEAAANPIITVTNKLQSAFRKWVKSLKVGTVDKPLVRLIHPNGKAISFNYTEFINTLYDVKDVCYIHGCRITKDKLILGHKPGVECMLHEKERKARSYRQSVIDAAQEEVLTLIGQCDEEITKDCQAIIKNNKSFFDSLKNITQIIVIGHSISVVDWDYFIEINKLVSNAHWYFGIYGLNDLRNMCNLVEKMCLKGYSVFRTDGIYTTTSAVEDTFKRNNEPKPINIIKDETSISVKQHYYLIIDDYELILPNTVNKIIILDNHLFIMNDVQKNIILLNKCDNKWSFIAKLESFGNQCLINCRLSHIFLTDENITFVFNNRVRTYELESGRLIINRQLQGARNLKYEGIDVINEFVTIYD